MILHNYVLVMNHWQLHDVSYCTSVESFGNYMMLAMLLMRNHWQLHGVSYGTDEESLTIT